MIGHLGSRVSALLDGRLDPAEADRAWAHVHECHQCRDLVEHEGWLKRRLSCLSDGAGGAPDHLKGSLLDPPALPVRPPGPTAPAGRPRRLVGVGVATVGGGAVGAAVLGVLALGASPAAAPTMDQRAPLTQLVPTAPTLPAVGPTVDPSPEGR